MTDFDALDSLIAPHIRAAIEGRYYMRVNEQAQLQQALMDPLFLSHPTAHVALYADHGVVHVRNVAQQILQVLESIHGVLIPRRDGGRFTWMKHYGVAVAYAHDIGMIDFSGFGRAMHPEYATQAVLGAEFDDIVDGLWDGGQSVVALRLARLAEDEALDGPPQMVFREMLSMVNCHSKSKTPVTMLNDPAQLRKTMQTIAATDLHYLYRLQRLHKAESRLANAGQTVQSTPETGELVTTLQEAEVALRQASQSGKNSTLLDERLNRVYADFQRDAFLWLESDHTATRELVEDVVDTLRALRCADALRQRGTVLKTSGNYEVFVDQHTSNAIYALRLDSGHLYLLEIPDRISAGEANMASSELDKEGNLRIAFQHGRFNHPGAILNAAASAALVVNDIQTDVVESFQRPTDGAQTVKKLPAEIEILIENVDDNPEFADLIYQQLHSINPVISKQARVVPSLQNSSALERARYLCSPVLDWELSQRIDLLKRIAQFGHKIEGIDPVEGFKETREIKLQAGDTLIEAGAPAGFVYVPLAEGLRIEPLGGYQALKSEAWVPVGVTGVIRGAVRNAHVLAEQDMSLLAIPKDVYLNHWHQTYNQQEFGQLFKRVA